METWKQLGFQVSLWGLVAPPSHLSFPWPHMPRDSRGLAVSDKVWLPEGRELLGPFWTALASYLLGY